MKKGVAMEHKIQLFETTKKKFQLTDRQVKYLFSRLKKEHEKDNWLFVSVDNTGQQELWIRLEAVQWIEDVYLNFDIPFYDAEINFAKKQIERLANELDIQDEYFLQPSYQDMSVAELSMYFRKKANTIYKQINALKTNHDSWIYKKGKCRMVTKEGVQYLTEHIYRKKYIENLYNLKRVLQTIKLERSEQHENAII